MKKTLSLLCCLCILFSLLGCQTPKKITPPKQIVEDYLHNLAKGDLKSAVAISGEIYHENEFGDSSYDGKDLKKLMFSNLQYTIQTETIDSKAERATVNVEISNTDYVQILQEAKDYVASDAQTSSLQEGEMNQVVMKKAKQLLKESKPRTQRVSVLLEKQKNGEFQMIADNAPFYLAVSGQNAQIEN